MAKLVCEVCGHLFEGEIEQGTLNPECPKCSNPETKTTTDLTEYETTPEMNAKEQTAQGSDRLSADRPSLDEEEHKSYSIKFNDAEWQEIEEKAKRASMTVSVYIRWAALNYPKKG